MRAHRSGNREHQISQQFACPQQIAAQVLENFGDHAAAELAIHMVPSHERSLAQSTLASKDCAVIINWTSNHHCDLNQKVLGFICTLSLDVSTIKQGETSGFACFEQARSSYTQDMHLILFLVRGQKLEKALLAELQGLQKIHIAVANQITRLKVSTGA